MADNLRMVLNHPHAQLVALCDNDAAKARALADRFGVPDVFTDFEELLEAITLKRLGVFLGPIVIVNTRGYFAPLLELFAAAVRERFMDERHLAMWQVVAAPEDVLTALRHAPPWSAEARRFASV